MSSVIYNLKGYSNIDYVNFTTFHISTILKFGPLHNYIIIDDLFIDIQKLKKLQIMEMKIKSKKINQIARTGFVASVSKNKVNRNWRDRPTAILTPKNRNWRDR
jgi:hypothetical protein